MAEQSFSERGRKLILEEFDLLLFLFFFAFLMWRAVTTLRGEPLQFPLLFLLFGFIALSVEVAVRLLPATYSEPIQRLTTGIAAEMDEEAAEELVAKEQEVEEEDGEEEEIAESETEEYLVDRMSDIQVVVVSIVLITGFGVLSYYISFMLAMPFFVFAGFYFLGRRNWVNAVLTTIVLLVLLQVVFANVMNVPIDSGILFGWEDLMRRL